LQFGYRVGFAEVIQERLAAAIALILGKAHDGIQMLLGHQALGAFLLVDKILLISPHPNNYTAAGSAQASHPVRPGRSPGNSLRYFGQVVVQHEAHIRLIDTHTESDGGDDDLDVVVDEGFLVAAALVILRPSMVRRAL